MRAGVRWPSRRAPVKHFARNLAQQGQPGLRIRRMGRVTARGSITNAAESFGLGSCRVVSTFNITCSMCAPPTDAHEMPARPRFAHMCLIIYTAGSRVVRPMYGTVLVPVSSHQTGRRQPDSDPEPPCVHTNAARMPFAYNVRPAGSASVGPHLMALATPLRYSRAIHNATRTRAPSAGRDRAPIWHLYRPKARGKRRARPPPPLVPWPGR